MFNLKESRLRYKNLAHHVIVSANFTSLKIKGSLISAVGQSAFLTSASKRTQFESIALQVVNALSRAKSREMLGR